MYIYMYVYVYKHRLIYIPDCDAMFNSLCNAIHFKQTISTKHIGQITSFAAWF